MFGEEREFWFNNYGTWSHWGFYLTKKDVTPPEPKTNLIELDGMDGALDLSEALTGEVTYHNRIITATFWSCQGTYDDRTRQLDSITASIHGRKMEIHEPDDPHHYFYGRVRVVSQKNTRAYAEFSIEAVCDPWRYTRTEYTPNIEVSSTEPVEWSFHNWGQKTICPEITVEGEVAFTCNGVTSEATTGQYKITTFKLFPGSNIILVSGNGTISLRFREAIL